MITSPKITEAVELRETIARITNPNSWALLDRLLAQADRGVYDDGEPMSAREAANIRQDAPGLVKASFAKSDRILALPQIVEVVGALRAMTYGLPDLLEAIGYTDDEDMVGKAEQALAAFDTSRPDDAEGGA